jgi:hypothetical protein
MWEMERELKDTAYTIALPLTLRDCPLTLEDSVRTLTSKSVHAQCLTEAHEMMRELIEMRGEVVAYANEQAQNYIAKVVKSIYHNTTNHRIDLMESVCTLSGGRRLVTPTTTEHAHLLRRRGDFHWAKGEASANREGQRRHKGFGASAWPGKKETPSHQTGGIRANRAGWRLWPGIRRRTIRFERSSASGRGKPVIDTRHGPSDAHVTGPLPGAREA